MNLENVSFLEGLRLTLAFVCLVALGWAWASAQNGVMAFARPIRAGMLARRRWQIAKNVAIILGIAAQTVWAAGVPDPAVISGAGMAVSYLLLWIESLILISTLIFSIGWAGVEEVLQKTPLVPTEAELRAEAAATGRDLGHIARTEMTVLITTLESLSIDPSTPEHQRAFITRAMQGYEAVEGEVERLHERIRELDPSESMP